MLAKQTQMKFKTGQYLRIKDSRWQFKRKERLKFEIQEQKDQMVAKQTEIKFENLTGTGQYRRIQGNNSNGKKVSTSKYKSKKAT